MNDGLFLQSIEGLDVSPAGDGSAWEMLQGQKEFVCREICAAGYAQNERERSEEFAEEIKWSHRERLETRLREIIDAQDRLVDGLYGCCADCGARIPESRLAADPASTRCFNCQTAIEREVTCHTM